MGYQQVDQATVSLDYTALFWAIRLLGLQQSQSHFSCGANLPSRVANAKRKIRNRNRNQMALNTGFSFCESKRCCPESKKL